MCVVSGGENAVRTTLTGVYDELVHRSEAEMRRLWCAKQKGYPCGSFFAWQTDGSGSVRHGALKIRKNFAWQTDGSGSVRHGTFNVVKSFVIKWTN